MNTNILPPTFRQNAREFPGRPSLASVSALPAPLNTKQATYSLLFPSLNSQLGFEVCLRILNSCHVSLYTKQPFLGQLSDDLKSIALH